LVTFFSPDDEGFRSNVNILVDGGIGEHFTLDEYADLAIEELSSFIENFEQIDFDEFETDNWKGYYIIYTGTYSEYELAWAQVFFMENDNVYIITFASTIDKYEVYISDAEFIAENLVLE
jgi:effector-binding domain-containing protein